ncbi:hypothetical protein ABFA07_002399 [Porites harrisoni]
MDSKEKTPNEPQGGEIQSALNSSSAAPPAYTPGDTAWSGYTAQPGYTVQQPGYPPKQQPYLAQPGYPLQTFSTVSMQPNETVIVSPPPERPPSHLCLSIFSCLCCFWPLGLAALCVSCSVDSSYNAGDYQRALSRSNTAKWLNIVSIICGVILIAVIAFVRATAKTTSDTYDPYN